MRTTVVEAVFLFSSQFMVENCEVDAIMAIRNRQEFVVGRMGVLGTPASSVVSLKFSHSIIVQVGKGRLEELNSPQLPQFE